MTVVGSDAAFMLEKALEEMDDIFREEKELKNTVHYSSLKKVNSMEKGNQVANLKKLFDGIELILSGNMLNASELLQNNEKNIVFEHLKSLAFTYAFLEDKLSDNHIGTDERIHQLKQQNQIFQVEINKLHEQIISNESQLAQTKKTLTEYARKNEELVIRLTERRIAEQKGLGKQQVNHNKFLLPEDEKDNEMERLKSHIETLLDEQGKRTSSGSSDGEDNMSGLKSRLREKASECNRLKMQLEEMNQLQEEKDSTIMKIQEQIQVLFQENENLQLQLSNVKALHQLTPKVSNGAIPHTPESVRSESIRSSRNRIINQQRNAKDLFNQIKGLKSASEPNLMRNGACVGIVGSPAMSLAGDESTYRSFHRMISDSPFATWPSEYIQDWLREEGLEEYIEACAKNVRKGDDLLKYTFSDFERELGISNPIHKRKLNYALKAVTSNSPDYSGRLNHHWVAKWLEDLGLPQYKQNFFENKVDGRVLLNLTVDDVLQLKVYSLLHHSSLKRAIQFLRHQKFHPQFLREVANQSEERCDHVMLWTNQRIMHWLRSVDLAEYAPNLRGSGVHGALMVLEPRFNADTLADLLSIPMNKTLLRRHLGSHFMTLLGDACQRQKEMTQKTSDFVPLNGSEKHKLRKKGLSFGSLRRKKSETDLDLLLCPMELDVSNLYSPPPALDPDSIFDLSESTSLSPSYTNDNASTSTNETNAVPRIVELSHEIDQMTSLLGNEN